MKIGRLLEFHQNNQTELGLPKNLGDSFLITKNKIYRDIRKKAVEFGFSYSGSVDENYLALPLSQLEAILKTKVLPYNDNVNVLFQVEQSIPNTTIWDDVTDNLKKNYVFHESCHAVARTYAESLFTKALEPEERILRLLIEESFSNTCELLGIIDVEDNAHRIFYELNSYIFMYDERTQLKKLVAEIGPSAVIQFLMGCYLFSNFLREKMSDSDYTALLKLLKLQSVSASAQKIMRSVSRIAFELNPRFRWVTTTFYLRLNGLPVTTDELSKIDLLGLLSRDPRFLKLIETLSRFETA